MIVLKELTPQDIQFKIIHKGIPYIGPLFFGVTLDGDVIFSEKVETEDGVVDIKLPKFLSNDYEYIIETKEGYKDPQPFIVRRSFVDSIHEKRVYPIEIDKDWDVDGEQRKILDGKVEEFYMKNGNRIHSLERDLDNKSLEWENKYNNIKEEYIRQDSQNTERHNKLLSDIDTYINQLNNTIDTNRKEALLSISEQGEKQSNLLYQEASTIRKELTSIKEDIIKSMLTNKKSSDTGLSTLEGKVAKIVEGIASSNILKYEVDDTKATTTNLWTAFKVEQELRDRVQNNGRYASSQNMFNTIAVSGEDDIEPSTPLDELTLVAGSNMTITTDSSTNTITFASSGGGGGGTIDGSGTTNEIPYWVDSNTLGSLATATYPSLAELSYLKGVTSAVQTQLNALANGMIYKGNWDASAGTFPGGGVAQTGWFYTVSVADTVDSVVFNIGDRLIATTNNASTTVYASNWTQLDATDAVTSVFGRVGNVVSASGDYTASQITNVPAGNISSVTVQAALDELQTDIDTRALKSGALTQFLGNGNWKLWYSDGSGDVQELALGADGTYLKSNGTSSAPSFDTPAGGGTPGGSNTQFQYNNAGSFGGIAELTWNNTNKVIVFDAIDDTGGVAEWASYIHNTGEDVYSYISHTRDIIEFLVTDGTDQSSFQGIGAGLSFSTTGYTNFNGNGVYDFKGTASQAAEARLYEDTDNGSNYVSLKAPTSIASSKTITLPDTTGTVALLSDITGTNSGVNTGDQTSIVGITGTKAQFDTACTDGNFLYTGDVTQYTDEMAQDAVGAMIDSSLAYVDGTPLLQRAALTGAITASAGSNSTALGSFTLSQLNTAVSDANIVPEAGGTFTGDISVPDEAYGAGRNGSMEVPTKNAIYDKIETISGGSGLTQPQVMARIFAGC